VRKNPKKKKRKDSARRAAETVREIGSENSGRRFLKVLPQVIPRLLLAIALTCVVAFFFLRDLGTGMLDLLTRFYPAESKSQVVIVEITDDDYEKIFDKKSPLDVAKLQQLIESVAGFEPRLIGIDIDTSDEKFRNLNIDRHLEKIVWASKPKLFENEKGNLDVFEINEARGGFAAGENSALPLLLDDPKITRHYRLLIKVGD